LLTTGTLNAHLIDSNEQTLDRFRTIIEQTKIVQSVPEELKAHDPMGWVWLMDNIEAGAEEIANQELSYFYSCQKPEIIVDFRSTVITNESCDLRQIF